MTSRGLSLVLSLLAAGQLVALVSLSRSGRAPTPPEAPPDRPPTETEATAATPAELPTTFAPQPASRLAQEFHWATLESTNYATYIANLRAFGVPESTVRDIIIAEINRLYQPREAQLQTLWAQANTNRGSLTAIGAGSAAIRESRRQLHELRQEKIALIKTLLGPAAGLEVASLKGSDLAAIMAACDNLPLEKRDPVLEIELDHKAQAQALTEAWLALPSSERVRKGTAEVSKGFRRLEAERLARLNQVLSPGELEDYEMRSSSLAAHLSESLALFQPTEEEYRLIFRIRQQAQQADHAEAGELQPDENRQELEAQLKAALGEQRYAEYQRAQDPTYEELRHLAQRYSLPQDSTDQVYEALKPLLQKAEQIEMDDTLDEAQQNRALRQLRAQINRLLVERWGERAARAFRHYSDLFSDDSPEQ